MLQLLRHARTSTPATTPTPSPRHRAKRLLATVLGVVVLSTTAGLSSVAHADTPVPLSTTAADSVSALLTNLRTKSSSTDVRYLDNSVWIDGSPECFRCTLGPTVLAAARATSASDPLVRTAVSTTDRAITQHQNANGSWGPAAPGEGGYDIQTVLVADQLAWTYLMLGDKLDAAHRTRWAQSLRESADWLIANGNLTYYINGNINLAVAINMDLTYRITGLPRFSTAAASSLAFAIDPPQDRWPGFGLRYSTNPLLADGSDGAAYFAERGSGTPGFDPSYTIAQTDLVSMWFLLTGDQTALRLTNLLYNQLSPRVRTSDWTIDVTGGTRRDIPNARYAYSVPALAVLALRGGRPELQSLVKAQVNASLGDTTYSSRYVSSYLSYGFGTELAVMYFVVAQTPGW